MSSFAAQFASSSAPKGGAGFQGSPRSDIRITIYRRGSDLLSIPTSLLQLTGQSERDSNPSVVTCQVQMAMGQAASFQLTLKLPPDVEIWELCQDDDWLDIEIGRNGSFWHVMRGLIDETRCATTVAGGGATSRNILVTGQSFQKVWEQTPMWFSSIYGQQLGVPGQALSSKNASILGIGLNVPDTIASFLYTYNNRVAQAGRSSVAMPLDMPGVTTNFSSSWRQDASDFDDSDAPRINLLGSMFAPTQTVWETAMQWGDPYFVETFTAMLPRVVGVPTTRPPLGDTILQTVNGSSAIAALGPHFENVSNGLPVTQSVMTLVIRNKPFINIDPENSANLGYASPWFSLPTLVLNPQDVVALDVGRNGFERANCFFTSSQMLSITGETPIDAKSLPTWSVPDMSSFGMRPLSVMSNYIASTPAQSPGLTSTSTALRLRARLRDHNMANATYFTGNVSLGRCVPEMQIGTRVLLKGTTPSKNLTAYCEVVTHTYNPQVGWKSDLGLTRGYFGDDSAHMSLLQSLRAQYSEPLY